MAQTQADIRGRRLHGAFNRNMGILDCEVVAAGNARDYQGNPDSDGPPLGGFRVLTDGNLVCTTYAGNEVTLPAKAGEWWPGTWKGLSASTTCNVIAYW